MPDDLNEFEAEAATLIMSNKLKDIALQKASETGGDPAAALFGAAMKALDHKHGRGAWVPIATKWLSSILKAEGKPTSYS